MAIFISFEGGEGAGKTSQISLLYHALKDSGQSVIKTREPGGTESAELIRNLLVKDHNVTWEKTTELLLHLAARKEHVEKVIIPHLDAQTHVICDRFMDSTLAYQGYGHGISCDYITKLSQLTIGDTTPNITFILDIDYKTGLSRASERNNNETRYEQMACDFHERVRQGFLNIATTNPNRYVVIDATKTREIIHAQILDELTQRVDIL